MTIITKDELKEWHLLVKQIENGYHLEPSDLTQLIHLNHRVMEVAHEIHNSNMLNYLNK